MSSDEFNKFSFEVFSETSFNTFAHSRKRSNVFCDARFWFCL